MGEESSYYLARWTREDERRMGEECDILFLISKWNEMPVILSFNRNGCDYNYKPE
jgi:hypothetical protein